MKKIAILFIKAYRLLLSPFVGNCCRFYPSCSEYAIEAIQKRGFWRGGWLTFKRICKCGPWHRGGYDPVEGDTSCAMRAKSPAQPEGEARP
ncbi:MAG: membrane protein insertion efficiency factor YidD [Chlamydiales bacterium]|nr:membrane protein insertion efficiency factor YidD [Chlamydiales bacterium]